MIPLPQIYPTSRSNALPTERGCSCIKTIGMREFSSEQAKKKNFIHKQFNPNSFVRIFQCPKIMEM